MTSEVPSNFSHCDSAVDFHVMLNTKPFFEAFFLQNKQVQLKQDFWILQEVTLRHKASL